MINALYTLKKRYLGKKIYIWNINRDSLMLFTQVAFRRIDIQGFVTADDKYKNMAYMNRPLVTFEQIQDSDCLILLADKVSENVLNTMQGKGVYWKDAIEINEELRQKKIIIYGTGYGAEQLCELFEKHNIAVEFFCKTEQDNIKLYKERKIITASMLENYGDYAVVISPVLEKYKVEIMETLSMFQGDIFVRNFHDALDMLHINLWQRLNCAIEKHSQIYLYSRKNNMAELIEKLLQIYDVKLAGYVYENEDEMQGIKSIYELALNETQNNFVIINEECPERIIQARENVELAGFSLQEGNYVGIHFYTLASEKMLSVLKEHYDPLVAYSIFFPQGKQGWKVYGKEEKGGIRIVVLGGSTSSEEYHPENWVTKLYYKLRQNSIRTIIYNGAHSSNDIVSEVLRLVRDGHVLRPQIVISMSGVNNTLYKEYKNLFNEIRMVSLMKKWTHNSELCTGIDCDESLYSFWNRNEGLLKVISEFYGANFFAFLQPMNMTMNQMSLWEKSTYEVEQHIMGCSDFSKFSDQDSNYINLMRLFEHQDEMYYDMCHYTDEGHEVIAGKVYDAIMPTVSELLKLAF